MWRFAPSGGTGPNTLPSPSEGRNTASEPSASSTHNNSARLLEVRFRGFLTNLEGVNVAQSTFPVVVQASAAKTATGQTPQQSSYPFLSGDATRQGVLNLIANVTAVSGASASMTLSVQWSEDGTVWADSDPVDTFTAITATKSVVKQFQVKARLFRVVYTITGTSPSFTFSLTATGA